MSAIGQHAAWMQRCRLAALAGFPPPEPPTYDEEESSPHPEAYRANAAFFRMSAAVSAAPTLAAKDRLKQIVDAQHQPDRSAQYDAAAVASGAITPGDVVALRNQEARTVEITSAAQAAALYGAGSVAHQLLQGVTFEPLPEESQERAAAPNLQLPVTSGSSDGAEVADLRAALTDARSKFAKMQLSRDRCARERDSAIASSRQAHADAAVAHEGRAKAGSQLADARQLYANRDAADDEMFAQRREALTEAAAQFRAITGDFPGLTGPLVDIFKDVPK